MSQIYRGAFIGLIVMFMPYMASAQMFGIDQQMDFGQITVPRGGAVIEIDPDDNVVAGASNLITPPNPTAGQYRIQGGAPGNIDISVTNVVNCDATVTMADFDATWRGNNYNDISTNPIVGETYTGNDVLYLGMRLTYTDTVPIGHCDGSFEVTFTTY